MGGRDILDEVYDRHKGINRESTPALSEQFLKCQKGFSLDLVLLYHIGMMAI